MTEQMPTVNKRLPIPKPRRKGKISIPPNVRKAANAYKLAYHSTYGGYYRAALGWSMDKDCRTVRGRNSPPLKRNDHPA